jgi:hypothetical protein
MSHQIRIMKTDYALLLYQRYTEAGDVIQWGPPPHSNRYPWFLMKGSMRVFYQGQVSPLRAAMAADGDPQAADDARDYYDFQAPMLWQATPQTGSAHLVALEEVWMLSVFPLDRAWLLEMYPESLVDGILAAPSEWLGRGFTREEARHWRPCWELGTDVATGPAAKMKRAMPVEAIVNATWEQLFTEQAPARPRIVPPYEIRPRVR